MNRLITRFRVVEVSREDYLERRNIDALGEAVGILIIGQLPLDTARLDLMPRMRVVSLRAVGYDKVDLSACARRRITVCNTAGTLDRAVADLTVMHMLALTRRLGDNLGFDWASGATKPPLGMDISTTRIGLLGYGRIAKMTARTLSAGFGSEVVYHTRSGAVGDSDPYAHWVSREELFSTSQLVSIHTPLTDSTRASVGRAEFDLMKRSGYLVNTARGAIVDEPALIDALQTGAIAGAALDVLAAEPPESTNPLLAMSNVLITPHIGSGTTQTRHAMATRATDNLVRVLAGEWPISPVLDASGFLTAN
jgi:lactate dehydrogenase-like 2-hydroxyacid dehydrogenase